MRITGLMTRKQGWQGPLMSLPYNWLVCKNLDYIPSYALLSNMVHCHFVLTFVLTIQLQPGQYSFLCFLFNIHCSYTLIFITKMLS